MKKQLLQIFFFLIIMFMTMTGGFFAWSHRLIFTPNSRTSVGFYSSVTRESVLNYINEVAEDSDIENPVTITLPIVEGVPISSDIIDKAIGGVGIDSERAREVRNRHGDLFKSIWEDSFVRVYQKNNSLGRDRARIAVEINSVAKNMNRLNKMTSNGVISGLLRTQIIKSNNLILNLRTQITIKEEVVWKNILLYMSERVINRQYDFWTEPATRLKALAHKNYIIQASAELNLLAKRRYQLLHTYVGWGTINDEVHTYLMAWFEGQIHKFVSSLWKLERAASTSAQKEFALEANENFVSFKNDNPGLSDVETNDLQFFELKTEKKLLEIAFKEAELLSIQKQLQLADEIDDINIEIENIELEIDIQHQQLTDLQASLDASGLTEELETIESVIGDLEEKIENIELEITTLEEEQLVIETNINELINEKQRLIFLRSEKMITLSATNREISEKKIEELAATSRLNARIAEINGTNQDSDYLSAIAMNISLLEANISELNKNLVELKIFKGTLELAISGASNEITIINREIGVQNRLLIHNAFVIARKKQEKLVLEGRLENELLAKQRKEIEIQKLQNQINDLASDVSELESRKTSLDGDLRLLQQTLEDERTAMWQERTDHAIEIQRMNRRAAAQTENARQLYAVSTWNQRSQDFYNGLKNNSAQWTADQWTDDNNYQFWINLKNFEIFIKLKVRVLKYRSSGGRLGYSGSYYADVWSDLPSGGNWHSLKKIIANIGTDQTGGQFLWWGGAVDYFWDLENALASITNTREFKILKTEFQNRFNLARNAHHLASIFFDLFNSCGVRFMRSATGSGWDKSR